MGSVLDSSKEFLAYYYNISTGEWIDINLVEYKFNGREVDNRTKVFIGKFFHFIIDSNMLKRPTKIWLTSSMSSVRKCIEAYNNRSDMVEKLDIHSSEATVNRDKIKMRKYFDADMFYSVLAYPETYLEQNEDILNQLQREYTSDSNYRQALAIRIPGGVIETKISEENWKALKSLLQTYSKKRIRQLESDVSAYKSIYGYYNYLISNVILTSEEEERLNEIKGILGI